MKVGVPTEIKDDEYFQFFKHHFHDWNEPTEIIHTKAEGTVQYTALLYIPSQAPGNSAAWSSNPSRAGWPTAIFPRFLYFQPLSKPIIHSL